MELDDLSPSQLSIAQRLTTLVAPPSAETRSRLLAAMHAAPAGAPAGGRLWRRPGRLRRALLGASAVAVLLGVGVGALGLSAHARPGSPAYSLRLTGEHLRLWIAGPADRERLRVEFARERLQEVHESSHADRAVLETLLRDAHGYLDAAAHDLSASGIDQGTRNDLQHQIGNLQEQENQIGSQLGVEERSGQQGPVGGQHSDGSVGPDHNGAIGSLRSPDGGTGQGDPGPGSEHSGADPSGGDPGRSGAAAPGAHQTDEGSSPTANSGG